LIDRPPTLPELERDAPPDVVAGRGRVRSRRPLRGPAALAPPPTSWTSSAAASVLTLLMLLVIGTSVGVRTIQQQQRAVARAAEEARLDPERVTYVPAPTATAVPASPGAVAPRAEPAAGPRPGAPSAGGVLSSVPPAVRAPDSTAATRARGTAAPTVPTPRAVFTPEPCPAPCLDRGGRPRTYGGPGVLSNGVEAPALTAAQRDSVRREIAARVARAPRERGDAPVGPREPTPMNAPPIQSGVSIPVGLPGGGPTKAQRKRDSTINADVAARLARVKARADSIEKARRDSIERAKQQ